MDRASTQRIIQFSRCTNGRVHMFPIQYLWSWIYFSWDKIILALSINRQIWGGTDRWKLLVNDKGPSIMHIWYQRRWLPGDIGNQAMLSLNNIVYPPGRLRTNKYYDQIHIPMKLIPKFHGHISSNNSRETHIARPLERGMEVCLDFEVWSKSYLTFVVLGAILCSTEPWYIKSP